MKALFSNLGCSDYLIFAGLVLALVVIVYIALFFFQDKMKINAVATYIPGEQMEPPQISIKVVNRGKGMAILSMLGGKTDDGSVSSLFLNPMENGIRLRENETHTEIYELNDLHLPDESKGDLSYFKKLWIMDSHGHRHRVRRSRKAIRQLKAAGTSAG